MNTLNPNEWAVVDPAPQTGSTFPVRLSATSRSSRLRQRLSIHISPDRLPGDRPAWLAAGQRVIVARGLGAFSGVLRLAPNGPFIIHEAVRGSGLVIHVPGFPDLPEEGAASTPVDYDWGEGWFNITLPAWLRDTPASPQPVEPRVPAPPPPAPAPSAATPAAAPIARPGKKQPFTLAPGVSSHPEWLSPRGRAAHDAALKAAVA